MLNQKGGVTFKILNGLFVAVFFGLLVAGLLLFSIGKFQPYIVQSFEGRVAVYQVKKGTVEKAVEGDELYLQDILETGADSSAQMKMADEVSVTVTPQTKVDFRKPESFRWNWSSPRLHIEWGTLHITKRDTGFRKALQITVPGKVKEQKHADATIQITAPLFVLEAYSADFIVTKSPKNMEASVAVSGGDVKLRSGIQDGGFVMLRAGQMITVKEDMQLPEPSAFIKDDRPLLFSGTAAGERKQEGANLLEKLKRHEEFYSENGSFSRVKMAAAPEITFELEAGPSRAGTELFLEPVKKLKGYDEIVVALESLQGKAFPTRVLLELKDDQKLIRRFTMKTSSTEKTFSFPLNSKNNNLLTSLKLFVQTARDVDYWEGGFKIKSLSVKKS